MFRKISLANNISEFEMVSGYLFIFFIISCFIESPELKANSVDPDQMLTSVTSDLDLHCLPLFFLWNAI